MSYSMFAFAQKEAQEKKSYGKASLVFDNNSVYLGRKDSIVTPYLGTALGYYHKSGFFIEGVLYYLMRKGSNRIDETSLRGGYEFSICNFYGEIAAEKLFYNSGSTNVKSEVKGDISASLSYDFGFIETSFWPSINLGTKSDYLMSWGINHNFSLAREKLDITPSFWLNGSTRNFYGSYFTNRRFRKKNGAGPTVTASVLDASKFKLMDYELSLPFSYKIKKFVFGFVPTFSIPANPAVVTVVIKPPMGPPITKMNTEKIENTLYFSLSAEIKF